MAPAPRQVPSWGYDPIDRKYKFDRNNVEIPRYAAIEATFKARAQQHVEDFLTGRIDRKSLIKRFGADLKEAETQAFVAGHRARGSIVADITPAEARMLTGRHSRNMRYFHNFVRDMEAGRGRMDYRRRAGLYANSLWSVYTRGETTNWENPDKQARHHWILDPDAEHCLDCIARAKHSRDNDGYSWDELVEIGWPGEGTVCGTRCRCHVRVRRRRKAPTPDDVTTPENGIRSLVEELGGDVAQLPPPGTGATRVAEALTSDLLPARIPAQGIPFARMEPETVQRFVQAATAAQAPLAVALLGLVPSILSEPKTAHVDDESAEYTKGPIGVQARRDSLGLWRIVRIIFDPAKEHQWASLTSTL